MENINLKEETISYLILTFINVIKPGTHTLHQSSLKSDLNVINILHGFHLVYVTYEIVYIPERSKRSPTVNCFAVAEQDFKNYVC